MKLYKFEIFYKEKSINNLDIPLLFQKSNKMIIIIDLIRNKIRENPSKSLTFGIFEIFFNEEKQKYNTKLMQEITIKEISENYFINLISENKLAIFDNSIIYYITLDNNCLAASSLAPIILIICSATPLDLPEPATPSVSIVLAKLTETSLS
jgi:hypothetical protein